VLDLNRSERRALSAAVFLVGLAALSRAAWAPSSTDVQWKSVDPLGAGGSPRDEVATALAREARAQTPLEPGETIDLATAPPEELRRLPGVGPNLAREIERERAARPFRTVEDLERVPGIGPTTLARLRDRVRVPGVAALKAPALPGERPAGGSCGADLVDVNTAPANVLETLPGVGPALAGRILEHRSRHDPFRSAMDLEAVSGIGPSLTSRLASLVCTR